MQHLFTYGTLRKGGGANYLMVEALLIKTNVIIRGYALYSAGIYPFIKYSGNQNDLVIGDIYTVDDYLIQKLDDYEGDEYEKETIKGIDCIAYVWKTSPEGYIKIESGNWLEYLKKPNQDKKGTG